MSGYMVTAVTVTEFDVSCTEIVDIFVTIGTKDSAFFRSQNCVVMLQL